LDYRVDLPVYNGPLDLLLYLIKRDELDIYDIPISKITDTYISYVQSMRGLSEHGLDVNVAGDFLVMAATLMEIKSAMLLPKVESAPGADPAATDWADPRGDLVARLLEYKQFRDASEWLEHRKSEHNARFPRHPAAPDGHADQPPPIDLDEVQIWDLLGAFGRLMQEVGVRKPARHEVLYDDTPIDLHAADIEDRLTRDGRLSLRQLLIGRKSRSEMIGVFLAILELIRQKKILVTQGESLGDFDIDSAPPEHRASATAQPAPPSEIPPHDSQPS
jgi:segregation and condensation protein A